MLSWTFGHSRGPLVTFRLLKGTYRPLHHVLDIGQPFITFCPLASHSRGYFIMSWTLGHSLGLFIAFSPQEGTL